VWAERRLVFFFNVERAATYCNHWT